ncbi:MAG: biopolymer transporter ExbD [Hyphomonas sp.]|nr:biopolymer transporter ExbD [Hyphomonas sp.]HRX73221.1 biopolymer transporter ExbD [Hyphomonas sp.]
MIEARLSPEQEADETPLNLTPLIDVVFMLIVFLLLTANAAQLVVSVDLPKASSAAPADGVHLVMQPPVEEGGEWLLDGTAYESAGALRPVLSEALAASEDGALTISIEAAASSQRLIDAMDLANEAGAKAVEISAERRAE